MAVGYYIAELSEIISCQRRDDEQIAHLTEQLSNIFKSFFGDLHWIRFYSHFPNVCRLLYYSCTTLFERQTLGEEYLTLVQVSNQKHLTSVSLLQRILFVILESYGDVIFCKVLQKLQELKSRMGDKYRHFVEALLYLFENTTNLHKAIFFALHAEFYTFSRRLSQISYVSLRPQTNTISRLFSFMGASVIVQCLLVITFKTIEALKSDRQKIVHSQIKSDKTSKEASTNVMTTRRSSRLCSICLMSKAPVCTPCGHTFCWDCVVEYAEVENTETGYGRCPNCRSQFSSKQSYSTTQLLAYLSDFCIMKRT